MDTAVKRGSRTGRLNYPRGFKLKIAVQACAPGISVSQLAQSHQLNANMVFKWRREYRAGLFAGDDAQESTLLPVVVMATQDDLPPLTPPTPTRSCEHSGIIIEVGGAVVRVEGLVDASTLRLVIASLRE